jgi:catechol 2,3-dioxygenase-like lactoylglutathione lyase family enzyme
MAGTDERAGRVRSNPGMTHITQMATVLVPVADQDQVLRFFTETLGFRKAVDFSYEPNGRWLEVEPPGGGTRLSLVRSDVAGVETGVVYECADVEAEHAALAELGLASRVIREGDEPVRWSGSMLAGIPTMALFRDPDGNSYLLVQRV